MVSTSGVSGAPLVRNILILLPTLSFLRLLLTTSSSPSTVDTVLAYFTYTQPIHLVLSMSLIYQLRSVERLWSSRKLASFLLSILPYLAAVHGVSEKLLGGSSSAAGPTGLIFALLVHWHEMVPYQWKYASNDEGAARQGQEQREGGGTWAIEPSSKWQTYVLATQIAFAAWPTSPVIAAGGWVVGWLWRRGALPGRGIVDRVCRIKGIQS